MKRSRLQRYCCAALCIIAHCALAGSGRAGAKAEDDHAYDVRRIPPGIRVNSDAMIRENSVIFEVTNEQRATAYVTRVYTVFSREGRGFGQENLRYNSRFNKITNLEGAIYDEHGEEVRTLESSDVKDESDIDAGMLYEDIRVRSAQLFFDRYPYSVRFTYREISDGYLAWPDWVAQPSDEPVEHTRFEVILPAGWPLRYWSGKDTLRPVEKTLEDGRRSFVWEERNLPQLTAEQSAEDPENRTHVVHVAPGKFQIENYPGDMSTWRDFGLWTYALYSGRGILPPGAINDVQEAIKQAASEKEKIDTLYRYLQSRTRYVGVELGIGGWQPFDARFVHEKRYGDCKALANYMVALLGAAGITAYPALVHGGKSRSPVIEDFPCNKFNHVIVCIPRAKDSLWLDCTNDLLPSGFLGDFAENRPALLLTPQGGVLVHTPSTDAGDNMFARTGRVVLTPAGNASGIFITKRTGNQAIDVREELASASPRERLEWIQGDIKVVGTTVTAQSITGLEPTGRTLSIAAQVNLPNLVNLTGGRIFFQPEVSNRNVTPPRDYANRKSPVRCLYPYIDVDSIEYVIPAGYASEALPGAAVLTAPFGSFRSSALALSDTAILFTRRIEIRSSLIPATDYHEYVKFRQAVARSDKAQVVLTRKK